MPKISLEAVDARREEIISACETLYQTMGFRDVTIKDIAKYTSLSRPSIYNYFETKEEIFLAILQREYELWVKDIEDLMAEHEELTRDELAHELATSLERRELLLKLMSMNHYDMEANSSMERLTRFKVAYGNSIKAVDGLLQKFCPDLNAREREEFLYAFFPFIYGVYPYTVVTDKQKEAMERANTEFVYLSIHEMTYRCVKKLLEV